VTILAVVRISHSSSWLYRGDANHDQFRLVAIVRATSQPVIASTVTVHQSL
jgi:hypothetical protein